MILTDREIAIALRTGQIIIDPPPTEEAFSPSSVDLTLHSAGRVWVANGGIPLRPGHRDYKYTSALALQKEVDINGFTLPPQQLLLAWTKEKIELPVHSRLAARVEGKSALARIGLGVHINAPTIHVGFKGQIQLEMVNFGNHEIILDAGMRVCQLIFEQSLGTPEKGYSGQFAGQKGA